MVKVCLSCESRTPMDKQGEDGKESHGFCNRTKPDELSDCAKVYIEWMRLPKPKPTLPEYYRRTHAKDDVLRVVLHGDAVERGGEQGGVHDPEVLQQLRLQAP